MKIKSKRKIYLLSMVLKSKRLKSLFLALFFVFFNIGLACTSFYYGAVAQKHGITQRIKRFFKDDFPKYPYLLNYYAKGFVEKVPEIKIDMFKIFKSFNEKILIRTEFRK